MGVDSRHKIIHTILASAANVSDVLELPHLLHGRETCVWGDQAYQGHTDTIHSVAALTNMYMVRRQLLRV